MFADMLLIVEISNKNIMVKPFDTGSGVDDLLNSFLYSQNLGFSLDFIIP